MFSFGKYKSKNAEWLSWGTWKSITQLGKNINDNSSLTLFVGFLQPAFRFVLLDFFQLPLTKFLVQYLFAFSDSFIVDNLITSSWVDLRDSSVL